MKTEHSPRPSDLLLRDLAKVLSEYRITPDARERIISLFNSLAIERDRLRDRLATEPRFLGGDNDRVWEMSATETLGDKMLRRYHVAHNRSRGRCEVLYSTGIYGRTRCYNGEPLTPIAISEARVRMVCKQCLAVLEKEGRAAVLDLRDGSLALAPEPSLFFSDTQICGCPTRHNRSQCFATRSGLELQHDGMDEDCKCSCHNGDLT